MLKVVLYIFAVLGLLISPVYAQAAQRNCDVVAEQAMAMKGGTPAMDMSSCCDKDTAKSTKTTTKVKTCFDNCIAMCGITVACASHSLHTLPIRAFETVAFFAPDMSVSTSEPKLFAPPPRLNA